VEKKMKKTTKQSFKITQKVFEISNDYGWHIECYVAKKNGYFQIRWYFNNGEDWLVKKYKTPMYVRRFLDSLCDHIKDAYAGYNITISDYSIIAV
jgi:hypothetical protein